MLYPFNEKYSNFILKYSRTLLFDIIGCITKDVLYYHSNIADIPDFWIKDAELGIVGQFADSILVISEDTDNYEKITGLASASRSKLTFASPPPEDILLKCMENHIAYDILKYKRIDKNVPALNIRQIQKPFDNKNLIEIGLRLLIALKAMGYDVRIRSGHDSLGIFNMDSDSPQFIINLNEYCEPSADEFTVLISDKLSTSLNNYSFNGSDVCISLHGGNTAGIKPGNLFKLNLTGSSIQPLVDFVKANIIYPNLNFEKYFKRCRKEFIEKYKNSVHFYNISNNNYLIFSALRKSTSLNASTSKLLKDIYMKKELSGECIKRYSKNFDLIGKLEGCNMLFRDSHEKEKNIKLRLSLMPEIINQDEYTISFIGSGNCNLSCKYCFSDHNNKNLKGDGPDAEVIRKGLDFILKRSGKKQDLIKVDYLIGSEPILKLDSYKATMEICREYEKIWGTNINLGILTNGTLLTDEIIEFFDHESRWMGFSLDGGMSINDSMRIFKSGEGSYKNALKWIKKILALNWEYPPGASAVLTSRNPDVLKVFLDLWRIGFRVIVIRPVRVPKDTGFALTCEHLPEIKAGYARLAKYLLSRLKEGKSEYLKAILIENDYFGRFLIRAFCNSRIIIKHCPAGKSFFSVRNDGSIYACDSLNAMNLSGLGDLTSGISKGALPKYVTDEEPCKDCWARFICGGACAHIKALDADGSLMKADCELVRFLIELSFHFHMEAKKILSYSQYDLIVGHIQKCNRFFEKGTDNFAYGPR